MFNNLFREKFYVREFKDECFVSLIMEKRQFLRCYSTYFCTWI